MSKIREEKDNEPTIALSISIDKELEEDDTWEEVDNASE